MQMKKIAAMGAAALLSLTVSAAAGSSVAPVASAQSNPFAMSSQLSSQLFKGSSKSSGSKTSTSYAAERRTVNVPGQGQRSYLLEKPSNFNPEASIYNVLLGFGGWQHTAETARGYMKLGNTASHTLHVYPEPRSNAQGPGWEGPTYAPTRRGEDVAFVRAIIDDLERNGFSPNRKKIWATGLSNGGGMALNLACQAPDLVAGVAVVASANYTPIFDSCTGKVPTLFMHGTRDDVALYDSNGYGNGGAFISAREAFRRVSERNGCLTSLSEQVSPNSDYDTLTYPACDKGKEVQLARVNGGGHTWFPSSPSATTVVWNFLSTKSK